MADMNDIINILKHADKFAVVANIEGELVLLSSERDDEASKLHSLALFHLETDYKRLDG